MSLVEATIFMVFVIFSIFLMDFRRPSISRRVAKLAALATAGLRQNTNVSFSATLRLEEPLELDRSSLQNIVAIC